MLTVRLILEIIVAPYTLVQQYRFIKNLASAFETNKFKLNVYPLFLAPVSFVIRLKDVATGKITY